jgi:hypothetical protein
MLSAISFGQKIHAYGNAKVAYTPAALNWTVSERSLSVDLINGALAASGP